jgi:diguanylate cyclase (GGDEF)-like protein/PAS domain S-box-containing protein
MKTIGLRLALYFGLTILLACVGIGVFAISYSSYILEEAAERTLPVYGNGTARLVENSLKTQLATLDTIAQRNVIRELNWPEQKSALSKEVDRLGYLHMGFARPDGQLMTTNDTTVDISNQSFFLQALEGRSVIAPYQDTSENTIMLGSPVIDHNDNIVGVLIAAMEWRKFNDTVAGIELGSGSPFIIDNQGQVIAHPDYDEVLHQVNLIQRAEYDDDYRDLADFLSNSIIEGTGRGHFRLAGEEYYAAVDPLGINDWFVVVEVPRAEVMAPLNDLYKVLFVITVLLLFLGLMIAYLASRQIAFPIRHISQHYARMASGDFSGTLDVGLQKRRDEIGELARGYQQISRSLNRTITELEASEQRFRMITENMVDLVSLTDLNGYMQYVSPSHESITGWKVRHIVGRCVFDSMHPDDVETARRLYDNIVRSKRPGTGIYRIMRADGEYRWLETVGKPLLDARGKVVSMIAASRDIHERRQSEEQIRYMIEHDTLTGLYNRRYFENQMQLLDEQLLVPVSLIICDIDGLKFVNDTLGHQAGDELLLTAAEIVSNAAPEESVVARIGGDELGILLPNYSAEPANYIADNIRKAIANHNASNSNILSMSIGTAGRDTPDLSMAFVFKEANQQMDREKLLHNQSARSAVVDVVMSALEARDFVTEGHTDRLQDLSTAIARKLDWSESRINALTLFARFHDIGKVGVPDAILFKEGRLTPEEYEEMKKHSEIGFRIAQSSPDLVHIADFILKHHEWWDGGGYPLGLKGEDIPLECRIVAVADAYDAMNSDRPYRQALQHDEIIRELREGSGSQFDPTIIKIFLQILGEDD